MRDRHENRHTEIDAVIISPEMITALFLLPFFPGEGPEKAKKAVHRTYGTASQNSLL